MAVRTDKIRSTLIDTVRAEVSAVTTNNDKVSQKEQELLAPELQRAASYARMQKPKGATITTQDVVDSYASYFDRVNSAVNTTGPQYLSYDETASVKNSALQVRIIQARSELEHEAPFALTATMSKPERLDCIREHTARRHFINPEDTFFDPRYPPERTDHKVLAEKVTELREWAASHLYAEQIAAGSTLEEAMAEDLGGIGLEALSDDKGRLLGYELTLTHNQGEMGTTYIFDKWGGQIGEESADV